MSRSHKKSIVCKQSNTKGMKRCANKRVRRIQKDEIRNGEVKIGKGKKYQREFSSYDICDYKFCDEIDMTKKQLEKKLKEDKDFRKWYYNK